MRNVTISLVLLLLFCLGTYAQTTSGSIAGGVVDAQHSAVPAAVVTATEQEQKFTLSTRTDESGRFVFTQIPPG
ncbi:MAG TPA: carboxypeptidase-like regulatory domain-containing protein, partial [Bryobacteraceae bacterium]